MCSVLHDVKKRTWQLSKAKSFASLLTDTSQPRKSVIMNVLAL